VQQDPAGEGVNWYAYAANNPVVEIDPDGLRVTDPKCQKAILDAEKAGKKIETEIDKMKRFLDGLTPLCKYTRGKTPHQQWKGHAGEIEQARTRLRDALRRIALHCKGKDRSEHAGRIGKAGSWLDVPTPGFNMSPFGLPFMPMPFPSPMPAPAPGACPLPMPLPA